MGRQNVLLAHLSKQVFQDRLQNRYLLDPFGTGCVEFFCFKRFMSGYTYTLGVSVVVWFWRTCHPTDFIKVSKLVDCRPAWLIGLYNGLTIRKGYIPENTNR